MSGARQGRRRRILQEEVLSASRELAAYSPGEETRSESGEGRRYAFDEGSLGSTLAKRHYPAAAMAPLAIAVGSAVVVVGLGALHQYRSTIGSTMGPQAASLFDASQPQSLASWLASSAMLTVALFGVLILAVRRRRVDDYRGRYRLWRGAVVAALFLSVDAITNLHAVAADAASTLAGGRLMAGGAEWWIAIGTLAFGWVGARVLLDVKESKLALAAMVAAVVAGCMAVVVPLIGVGGEAVVLVAKLSQLSSYLLVTVSLVAYMRFLRQDAAAGVATKPQKSRPADVKLAKETTAEPTANTRKAKSQSEDSSESTDEYGPPARSRRKAKQQQAEAAQDESRWTDGSDGWQDGYEDDAQPRKLSKSERKRLRQQKADRRAA